MDKEQKGKAAASETTAQPPQNAALLANRYYQVHSAESSQKRCFLAVFFVPFVLFVPFRVNSWLNFSLRPPRSLRLIFFVPFRGRTNSCLFCYPV